MVAVQFSVDAVTETNEAVYITGSTAGLGSWNPCKALPLEKQTFNIEESNTWRRVIDLSGECEFRFFIGRCLEDKSGQQQLIVLRWESNILPRKIDTKNGAQDSVSCQFGYIVGQKTVSRGWLMGTTHTQIRLHGNPIYMWKQQHRLQTYRVHCIPMDYGIKDPSSTNLARVDQDDEESREFPPHCNKSVITCYSLKDENQSPAPQEQYGHIYQSDDYLVFECQTFSPEHLGYQLDFYVDEPNHLPRYVGYAYILPINQAKSKSLGKKKVPINGLRHKPIGEVSIEYFITKPFTEHTMDLGVSFQSHWRRNGRSWNVGHRGMGESYKKVALVRENTVASLSSAGTHGADLVEFDVMLTKDLEPIVYHDYSVCLLHRKRDQEKEDMIVVPVKDLTCEQLQSLRLYHASSSAENQIRLDRDKTEHDDLQPFPTLHQCLDRVPLEVGFNIEVKYPMESEDGHEMSNYFDHNLQVNKILQTVFDSAGSRRIIFSSFDPETCIMLQLKQNKYPVLFLSNGPTQRYTPYVDFRARDYKMGISFAVAQGFLGVNFQSEGLLKDLSLIQKTRDAGLVLFVWGADNNNQDVLDLMRQNEVDGVVYDRIDFYTLDKGKQFVLDSSGMLGDFGVSSSSS